MPDIFVAIVAGEEGAGGAAWWLFLFFVSGQIGFWRPTCRTRVARLSAVAAEMCVLAALSWASTFVEECTTRSGRGCAVSRTNGLNAGIQWLICSGLVCQGLACRLRCELQDDMPVELVPWKCVAHRPEPPEALVVRSP